MKRSAPLRRTPLRARSRLKRARPGQGRAFQRAMRLAGGNPKPSGQRRREQAREDRAEAAVKRTVRAACVVRDGRCRMTRVPGYEQIFGPCRGRSEWNHLRRRARTGGQPAEVRHNTATSCMNCERHHDMIDEFLVRVLGIDPLAGKGADGPLTYAHGGQTYAEAA